MNQSPLWQDLITLAVVLGSVAYLARRWWPALNSLLGRDATAGKTGGAACGQGAGACKQCGSSGDTPQKDHRIVIVRRHK
jgi:hypothetical protein